MAERAYAIVPHTSKAITAVNCGIDPHLVRDITEAEPDGIPARCLPELLEGAGVRLRLVLLGDRALRGPQGPRRELRLRGLPIPSRSMDNGRASRSPTTSAMKTTSCSSPAEDWLEQHEDKPFLATYLGVTGHHDYRPIDRYGSKEYSEDSALNHYQNEVRYLDFFVKNVIDQYKELGLYDDTIFVIYGDHGEGFGEHDLYQHDNTIYQEGLKVPFIIHDPGTIPERQARRDPDRTRWTSCPPYSTCSATRSRAASTRGGPSSLRRTEDRTLFFSCFDDYRCLASIRGRREVHLLLRQPARGGLRSVVRPLRDERHRRRAEQTRS